MQKDPLDNNSKFSVWYKYFICCFSIFFLLESYFTCLKEVCISYIKKHLENNCKVESKSISTYTITRELLYDCC